MSESESKQTTSAIPDEQLPPDLVPGEDNPLAEGLPDGEGSELLEGGKTADEMDDTDEGAGDDGAEKDGPGASS
ncbi:hypothetical protein GCM10027270_14300 [Nocardioides ginkgobilobae]